MTRRDENEQRLRARGADLLDSTGSILNGGLVDDELRQIRVQVRPGDRRYREGSTFERDDFVAFRYRIVRLIAKGGMGEVYEAEDLELGERIALKVVRRERSEKTRVFEQLKREIFLARKVTHPNVCRIFDVGFHLVQRPGGEKRIPFITMELLQGETLATRLKRAGPMDPTEAISCVLQMIGALGAAHAVGIIHRDFKSGNVFLEDASGEGCAPRVVVTDFGLAKLGGEREAPEFVRAGTGRLRGTPAYMAPEQIECGPISAATDIFALGVVMYEMLTGVRPFAADASLGAAILRLEQPPPSPRTLRPAIHPELDAIILRCLARSPADRFESVHHLAAALSSRVCTSRRWRRFAAPIVAGVAIFALAAGAVAFRNALQVKTSASKPPASEVRSGNAFAERPPQHSLPRLSEAAWHYKDGLAAVRNLDIEAAREHFEQAVALEPSHALSHIELAEIFRKLGYGTRAMAEARKAYDLSDYLSREEALLVEARYRETIFEWEKAADVYRTLFEFFPTSIEYGLALARAEENSGKPEEALATISKLRSVPNPKGTDVGIDEAEAAMAIEISDYRRAEAATVRAASVSESRGAWSSAARNQQMLATILAAQGKFESAKEHRLDAMTLFMRAGDPMSRAEAVLARGREYEDSGDFDAALDAYREVKKDYRTAGEMRAVGIAAYAEFRVLWKVGRLRDALAAAEESVAIGRGVGDPDLGRRLIYVADALVKSGELVAASGNIQDAIELAERFHDQDLVALALDVRAEILRQQDDIDGAVQTRKKALDLAQRAGSRRAMTWLELDLTELLLDHGALEAAERSASAFIRRVAPHKSLPIARAQMLRTRALFGLGERGRAKDALDRSKDILPGARRGDLALEQGIWDARLRSPSSGREEIARVMGRARAASLFTVAMEAGLAAGEMEWDAGEHEQARARWRALEEEARTRGYHRLARLFREARAARTDRITPRY